MTKPIEIRWLIAHSPAYLFVRTAQAFKDELEKTCPGEFNIEILTMPDYINKYGDIPEMRLKPGAIPGIEEGSATNDHGGVFTPGEWSDSKLKWRAIFDGMRDGKIQMSQTQITIIGKHLYPPLNTLDLPFLFDSHDHLDRALESSVGTELLEAMGDQTGIRGLGYTYSGGYRVVGSNHPIRSIDELADVDLTTIDLTKLMFGPFCRKTRGRQTQTIDEIAMSAEAGGAIETTYLRFSGKHVLKTNHSMFMTSILVDDSFFDTLTTAQQAAFRAAAKVVARLERQWSVEDADKYEADAQENGVTICDITAEETARLKQASKLQYSEVFKYLKGSREIVDKINKFK